jgi:arginyl-tRNA synthetase
MNNTTNAKFGDLQCNSAMSIHKLLKTAGAADAPKVCHGDFIPRQTLLACRNR